MRILFIHEVNYVNKVIFEMHEFPELLALKGHEVTFFHYPEAPDNPRISWRTRRQVMSGRVHPAAQITLVTPPTLGGRSFERIIAPLLSIPGLRREIRNGRYDVIVLYAVPTTGWQTIAIARRAKTPVVFRALDVSHKIRRSPLAPLIRIAEKYIYRNADLLSANNPALADYCMEISGRTGPRSVDLPPIDLSHFEGDIGVDRRAELGLEPDHKVLLYMGTFFGFSGLDTVLRSLVDAFAQHEDLRLVLVGGGELEPTLRGMVTEFALEDRVIFTGVIPYSALPQYLHVADVAINPFVPELLTHVALPHKVLQYMAAGIPVVSTSLRGLRGILGDETGVSWVAGPERIAAAAIELAFRPESELKEISRSQRSFVVDTFSEQSSVTAFEESLATVL